MRPMAAITRDTSSSVTSRGSAVERSTIARAHWLTSLGSCFRCLIRFGMPQYGTPTTNKFSRFQRSPLPPDSPAAGSGLLRNHDPASLDTRIGVIRGRLGVILGVTADEHVSPSAIVRPHRQVNQAHHVRRGRRRRMHLGDQRHHARAVVIHRRPRPRDAPAKYASRPDRNSTPRSTRSCALRRTLCTSAAQPSKGT